MNLLIVDDEMLEITVIERMLDIEELGINQIFKAYSMNQAIAILEKEEIGIVLTDIEMPKGSGIDLAEWIREQGMQPVILFLTSHAVFDYAQKAVDLGVKQYLLKPVRKENLMESMMAAVESYQRMTRQKEYEQQVKTDEKWEIHPEDTLEEESKMGELINQVKEYIAEHLDQELKRADLAAMIYLHPDYLSHAFKDETGVSLSEYILQMRLDYALALLEKTNRNISDIAEKCGFGSLAYFTKTFKRKIGMSPKEYRKEHKDKN